MREEDFLGEVTKQACFGEGKLVCKEEFLSCLVILNAESGVKIRVETANDMFFICVELGHSVGEGPSDSCPVL